MAVSVNAKRYAQTVHLDKARVLFPGHDDRSFRPILDRLYAQCQDMTGWSDEWVRKHIYVSPYWVGNDKKGYYVQFTGRACELVYGLPFHYAMQSSEIEVKGYLNCADDNLGNYYAFLDALGTAPGRYNRTNTVNGKHSSKAKTGAERSLKVGSNKSDTQSGLYARRGERPGLEVSVKRRKLRKAAQDVSAQYAGIDGDGTERHLWAALVRKCAIIGYAHFESTLAERGIELQDFFTHFCDGADYKGREDEITFPIGPNNASIVQERLEI